MKYGDNEQCSNSMYKGPKENNKSGAEQTRISIKKSEVERILTIMH